MTTVAELIVKLQTLPQDAEVECGEEVSGAYYTQMEFRPVDIDEMRVFDFTNDKRSNLYGKVIVEIRA